MRDKIEIMRDLAAARGVFEQAKADWKSAESMLNVELAEAKQYDQQGRVMSWDAQREATAVSKARAKEAAKQETLRLRREAKIAQLRAEQARETARPVPVEDNDPSDNGPDDDAF